MKTLLFSDVDGCIINDTVPDYAAIQNVLSQLRQADIDIILSTAKTAHEIIALNQHLELTGPFIIENGGGVLVTSECAQRFSNQNIIPIGAYALITQGFQKPDTRVLEALCPEYSLLTKMSDLQLVDYCNLTEEGAILAKTRFFTEPIYIKNLSDSEVKQLKKRLSENKFYFVQTRKFLHVTTSKQNDKSVGISFVLSTMYGNQTCHTAAIGDSLNDTSMLNGCDDAYYILNQPLDEHPRHWQCVIEKGFIGWQTAVHDIITKKGMLCVNAK